jgi:hypothetical protein
MSPAARTAVIRLLPASADDVVAKAAANADAAERAGELTLPSDADLAAAGGTAVEPALPVIVGGRSFKGQFSSVNTPSDSTGAIGPTRYVQLVNVRFGIYSRTSNVPLS